MICQPDYLTQDIKCKVPRRATAALIIKVINALICFFDFFRAIVEWAETMTLGCYSQGHFWCKNLSITSDDSFRSD